MPGPFKTVVDLPLCISTVFGVIPKGHDSGKWRLITDLSFPCGHSVGPSAHCHYLTVDEIAANVARLAQVHSWPRYIDNE